MIIKPSRTQPATFNITAAKMTSAQSVAQVIFNNHTYIIIVRSLEVFYSSCCTAVSGFAFGLGPSQLGKPLTLQ
jgi:hypothetical protein